MTRISFIMPTFNRAAYIAESVQSVISQMAPDDELVVIDDGSTDDTGSVLQQFAGRLRYIRQENAGKSVALNRGLAITGGSFVWICDDDDLLLPGAVDRLLAVAEQTGADMAFGRYTRFRHENGTRIDMGTGYWPDLSLGAPARHILEDAFVMHNAAIVRRSAYKRVGPFDPVMLRSQDYEMFVRLALTSRIVGIDDVVFAQRKHEGDRGPARIAHRAGRSEQVWEKFDRLIFARVRRHVSLDYFAGLFDADHAEFAHRAGLLQRGCIMGRHGLWAEALDDFEEAAIVSPQSPLHAIEQQIVRRTVAGKHGFSSLVARPALQRALDLCQRGPAGEEILGQLARGMVWRVRGQDRLARSDSRRFLSRPPATWAMLKAAIRGAAPGDPALLAERQVPPTLDLATVAAIAADIVDSG